MTGSESEPGLVQRSIGHLYQRLVDFRSAGNGGAVSGVALSCSYVEMYGEEVYDLLNPVDVSKHHAYRGAMNGSASRSENAAPAGSLPVRDDDDWIPAVAPAVVLP